MITLHWTYQPFADLTLTELYTIMQLRSEVFVVEQNCVYQDADEKDLLCYHLCGWDGGKLVAYCRIMPPGLAFTEASIGRVLTAAPYRKNGTGRLLMQKAITETLQQFNCSQIIISAQLYLNKFYQSLNFQQISDVYLEDGIAHIKMMYTT